MKKIFPIALISVAILAGCARNQINADSILTNSVEVLPALVVSPNDQRAYQTLKLSNGIEVVLVSDPSVEKSAAALSVGVGLLHDPMSQQGMAHYLEHMLFLGTEKYPDTKGYSEFMTKNGGENNAYTWLDITNYMFKVNNSAYAEGLDRFADFFKSPKLYPEYSEKEKHAVNAEWSMRREMDFFGQYKLARSMMGEHPANRFLIGNLETLGDKENSKLHSEMVAFYEQYYSANIMKLAMISNLPLAKMAELAQQYFADIKNKKIEKPLVTTQLDFSKVGAKRVYYKPKEDVKQIKLDFTIENNTNQFAVKPNYFVTYLLSNEMQGSPAQLLRDKGWVTNLYASADPSLYGNYGSLSVNIDLTDEGMKYREDIVKVVMQYIDLIKHEGIDNKYFSEIKTALQNRFQFLEKGDEFDYVASLADSMQKYPLENVINSPYHYEQFDESAIKKVLSSLTAERLRVWYISKFEETDSKLHFYDGEYRIANIDASEIKSWNTKSQFALQLPTVNKLLPENFAVKSQLANSSSVPNVVVEQNGLKIWHLGSQAFAHQPKGSLTIAINTPLAKQSVKSAVLYSIWADLYNLQQSKLATEAQVAGMSLSLNASNGLSLSIAGFTDKQFLLAEEALGNLFLTIDEAAFKQALERQKQAIFNRGQQFPMQQAYQKMMELVTDGSFDDKDVLVQLDVLTVDDLKQLQSQTRNTHQTRVFSFGNYDQNDLNKIAKLIQAKLSPSSVSEYQKTKFWQPQLGERFVWQQDLDVADVAVVDLYVNPTPGYKTKAAGAVLRDHISTAVFEKLRTEEQLAYSVGASVRSIGEYSALMFYIQTPVKNVADMQLRFNQYKAEYEQELNQLDVATFEKLKAATLVSLTEPPKNLSEEVSPFIADWYKENFDYDSKAQLIKAVEETTLADVKAYYQQSVMNDQAARLNVQMRGKKFIDAPFAEIEKATLLKSVTHANNVMKFEQ